MAIFMTEANHEDIYFYRPHLPNVSTAQLFEISYEQENLRVKNRNVNSLFANLTEEKFDDAYNQYRQHLHLDFGPVLWEGKKYQLEEPLQNKWVVHPSPVGSILHCE